MSLLVAVGQSRDADSESAGQQAAQQALDGLGRAPVVFGWVIASYTHAIQQVLAGAANVLGELPMLGFSSSAELTSAGLVRRSVVIALFAGDGLQARAGWWPNFVANSAACVQDMLQTLQPDVDKRENLLLVADGLNGDVDYLCRATSEGGYPLAGCLAGGSLWGGRTFQVGGRKSGSGGLAGAVLSGDVVLGVGVAHGWQPVGAMVRLTDVQGMWVRSIDEQLPIETYARLFGYPARDWSFPPLNELVRLYPLGLREDSELVVRSPLHMEADGSLRMNSNLPEGARVEFMIGSREACLAAARQAAGAALEALGPTRPKLALVLADVACQAMLETQPGGEVAALREVFGDETPICGGYTLGQIARQSCSGPTRLLNQHIEVVLFGERTVDIEGVDGAV